MSAKEACVLGILNRNVVPFMRNSYREVWVEDAARLVSPLTIIVSVKIAQASTLLENKQAVLNEALVPSLHFQLTTKAFGACSHSISKHT